MSANGSILGATLPWAPFSDENSLTWILMFGAVGDLKLVYQLTIDGDAPVRLERWSGKMYDLKGVNNIADVEKVIGAEIDEICAAWKAMRA